MCVTADTPKWHDLCVKQPEQKEELNQKLCELLELFPGWDRWGVEGEEKGEGDEASQAFEELAQRIWGCGEGDREGAIARFE